MHTDPTLQCLRCQAELPGGSPAYCPQCAAPQMRCVEEEIAVAPPAADTAEERGATGPDRPVAVTACLTAAGATGLLSSLLAFPASRYFPVWSVCGAALAVALYARRTGMSAVSAGFGARLGLVTGALAGAAMTLMSAVFLALQRFAFGNGWKIDNFLTDRVNELVPAMAPEVQGQLWALSKVPDWRAGLMFFYIATVIVVMVSLSTFGGAVGGQYYAIRRRMMRAPMKQDRLGE